MSAAPERIPLPFPVGWFCVGEDPALAPGALERVRAFGQELILWKGEDGQAHLNEAYCPHLGAHLGYGGRVEGNTLRCPFHGWKFDGEGRCVEIPYAKRIPPKAAVASWPVVVRNGLIFTWYDPTGGAPRWEVPEVPEWGSDAWTEPQTRSFEVRTHAQEMAENTVDSVHFKFVHGTPNIPEMKAEIKGHEFHAFQGLTFKTRDGEKLGRVDIHLHGPGVGITRFQGIVETLLLITGLPIETELHQTTIRFIIKKIDGSEAATRGVSKAFVDEITRQYNQDIPIWENKRFLEKPVLCDGDGPIPLLRRYYKQFYPNLD